MSEGFMVKHRKTEYLLFGSLTALYFLTRLCNLTILPIFGDEAIYLNWSQTLAEDLRQLFIPLSDGKQPLYMWLTAPFTRLPLHPLIAARLIAVLAGFLSMVGMYLLVKKLVNWHAAAFAALFYILTPMLLFYDRLGVPDGLLATSGIWALYTGLLLFEKPSLKRALILGSILGLGLLTKSPAIFFIVLLPTIWLLYLAKKDILKKQFAQLVLYIAIAGSLGILISSILRISPLYSVIGERTNDFVFSPMHLLENPLDPFLGRVPEVWGWLLGYLTVPMLLFAAIGLSIGLAYKRLYVIVLFLWFFVPLILEMALAKGFTPRYFLFTIPPLIMLSALGFYWTLTHLLEQKKILRYLVFLLLLVPAQFAYLLITQPERAPIPQKERSGYFEDWTSGWGIYEVSRYIRSLPTDQPILVGTEGRFGTLPDGLIAYTRRTPNIHVEGMGQPVHVDRIAPQLKDWLAQDANHRAFLVANQSRMKIDQELDKLMLIAEYEKPSGPNGADSLLFFEVLR